MFSLGGLCGAFAVSRPKLANVNVYRMSGSLENRGSLGFGYYRRDGVWLSHRRHFQQKGPLDKLPFTIDNHVIVFDGRIKNYDVLKQKLVDETNFDVKTKLDAEVVLLCFIAFGDSVISMLKGDFAFCVYVHEENRFFVARDQFGTKPMFYYQDGDVFMFASSIESLLCSGYINIEIDWDMFDSNILCTSYFCDKKKSLIKGIYQVPAGYFGWVDVVDDKINCEWKKHHNALDNTDKVFDIDTIYQLLKESVDSSLNEGTVSFLSGGLSSSIISLLANQDQNTLCLSIKYGEQEDSKYSMEIGEQKQLNQKVMPIQGAVFTLSALSRAVDLSGILLDYRHIYSMVNYSAVSADKNSAVLSGQGIDLLLKQYNDTQFFDKLKNTLISGTPAELLQCFVPMTFQYDDNTLEQVGNKLKERILAYDTDVDKAVEKFLIYESIYRLKYIEDWLSFQCRVNSRLPFLDTDIIEYLLQCKAEDLHQGNKRYVLEKLGELLEVPESVIQRGKETPSIHPSIFHQELVSLATRFIFKASNYEMVTRVYGDNININEFSPPELFRLVMLFLTNERILGYQKPLGLEIEPEDNLDVDQFDPVEYEILSEDNSDEEILWESSSYEDDSTPEPESYSEETDI